MNTHNADGAHTQAHTAHTYDVGRISARRFAGVRISGDLILRVAMVIFLAVSLYAQLDHTAYVVEHLARKSTSGTHAYALAVAVEFSVLLFVLAGHRRISWAFAAATFLTNLSFYWIQLDGQWQSAEGLMAVLMALLLPGVIIGYSHSAVGAHGAGAHADDADGAQEDAQGAGDTHTQAYTHAGGADVRVAAHTERAYSAQAYAGAAHTAQEGADMHADVHVDAQVGAQVGAQGADDADAEAPVPAQKRTQTTQGAGAGMTRQQRLMHIKESGALDAAQVAAQYGIKLRQAQIDIKEVREAMTQVNGTAVHA